MTQLPPHTERYIFRVTESFSSSLAELYVSVVGVPSEEDAPLAVRAMANLRARDKVLSPGPASEFAAVFDRLGQRETSTRWGMSSGFCFGQKVPSTEIYVSAHGPSPIAVIKAAQEAFTVLNKPNVVNDVPHLVGPLVP